MSYARTQQRTDNERQTVLRLLTVGRVGVGQNFHLLLSTSEISYAVCRRSHSQTTLSTLQQVPQDPKLTELNQPEKQDARGCEVRRLNFLHMFKNTRYKPHKSRFFRMAIDCSALGMGVATDRATRSMLPRAYALDNAADLRGRIFITSTTTRQNAPSPSCGVSLALDLRRSPLAACHGCSSTWLGPGHLMVSGDFELWAWATWERLYVSVLETRSDQNSSPLWRYEQDHEAFAKWGEQYFSLHTHARTHTYTHTYIEDVILTHIQEHTHARTHTHTLT